MKEAEADAPAASVTVQVTAVVPSAKIEPEAGVHTGAMAPSWASSPVAVNVTAAPAALVALVLMSFGTATVGGVLVTVTVNEPVAVRPPESVTVQFTVVVPSAKVEPEAGAHTAGTEPSCASLPATL